MCRRTLIISRENLYSIKRSIISKPIILIPCLNPRDKLSISFITLPKPLHSISGLDFCHLPTHRILALELESLNCTVIRPNALVIHESDLQCNNVTVQRTQRSFPGSVVRRVQLTLLLGVPVLAVAEDCFQTVYSEVSPRVFLGKYETTEVERNRSVLTGFPVSPDTVFDQKTGTSDF